MEGIETEFLSDTGADVTVITERTAGRIGGRVRQTRRELFGAGGKKLGVLGVKEIEIEDQNGGKVRAEVTIIEGAKNNLLGKPEINSLKLLKRVYSVEIQKKFPRLYRELGQLPDTFEIKLKEDAIPIAIPVPRRLPLGLREATRRELEKMERMGVIEKVEEPREWCAGMVVAPKTSGAVRICVDLTALNKSVRREHFPLPRVEETLAMLEGSKIFSKMDANSGFWQINLSKESRKLTTFITPFGRFQFRKMPFGISAAPEFFQR